MSDFDSIRPYHDEEVRPTIDRLLSDNEFLHAIACLKFPRLGRYLPWLLKPMIKHLVAKQLEGVNSVLDLQLKVKAYMAEMMSRTTTDFSISGLDRLGDGKTYLFISNHRDIAMDPAFVNWSLFSTDRLTVRIAIGDNLLSKSYVSDLMRLNKSFIVKRNLKGAREKLKAAKELSGYIGHSLKNDGENIWIAQREGRAKDGIDATQPAVLKMISLSKPKDQSFGEYMASLNIVPVSISYEWDPCDDAKGCELYMKAEEGGYEKEEHEDVASIAAGITGNKGHVHVAFGTPITQVFEEPEELAAEIDRQVHENYYLMPSNLCAYRLLEGTLPSGADAARVDTVEPIFKGRLESMDSRWQEIVTKGYANAVYSQVGGKAPS